MYRHEPPDDDYQLFITIEVSLETANDPPASSTTQMVSDHGDINDIDPLVQPFELSSAADSESSSTVNKFLNTDLMACLLTPWQHIFSARRMGKNVLSSAQEWLATTHRSIQAASSSSQPEDVEILSKDDYGLAKGNSRLSFNEQQVELNYTNKPSIKIGGQNDSLSAKVDQGMGLEAASNERKL
ncbi:hypothetical protein F3Y22_tig00110575pilonHSYRG00059 [Hibiscus syriacus]|uniref:Uncharacterized protein n=1 Tax=Hibiscus syriacus TaxID=106335 RepID=A0A6A3A923_HIBSY|nr:hypothetical protein F3Y22_tig00110575pilonHSYRG00059 [Hibiscus syriacus]